MFLPQNKTQIIFYELKFSCLTANEFIENRRNWPKGKTTLRIFIYLFLRGVGAVLIFTVISWQSIMMIPHLEFPFYWCFWYEYRHEINSRLSRDANVHPGRIGSSVLFLHDRTSKSIPYRFASSCLFISTCMQQKRRRWKPQACFTLYDQLVLSLQDYCKCCKHKYKV